MERSMIGKVALVTGGASGIGLATSLLFAEYGASVVIADINAERGESAAAQLKAMGAQALFCLTDISKSEEVQNMVNAAANVYGRLDYAVNNAGIGGSAAGCRGKIDDIAEGPWRFLIDVNLTGTWLSMKYELMLMKKQNFGAIVNVASAFGLVGMPNTAAYSASKHGVIGLTRSAALDYITENIRINAVCPGWTDTSMATQKRTDNAYYQNMLSRQPIGRMGRPEEIANAIVWLCSDKASFASGAVFSVDGGWTAQ